MTGPALFGVDRLYNRRDTERILLGQFEGKPPKAVRRYIKRMSENLETAYQMGLSDGRQGKPQQDPPDIPETATETVSAALKAAFGAYRHGFEIGESLRDVSS